MNSEFELSDFLIQTPYLMTSADSLAIEKASNGHPQKEDWEKSTLSDFKRRVRKYYKNQQNQLCAYCRMEVSSATSYFHIEHIVPKSVHPEWMYNPLNLCVTCANCNSAKNNKEVLNDKDAKILPMDSFGYLIIHPHLDRYFEHIEIVDGLLYKGLTPKGTKTIEICNLTRTGLLSERAYQLIRKDQESFHYSKLLVTYTQNYMCIANMDELLQEIQKLMESLDVPMK